MKWEEKRYTPQELQRMQQEAVERVRQMQRRSEQAIRHSPRAPSFFVQDSPPKETQQQRQPELPPQADSAKVMAQARSRAKSLDCFFMVVIPPIYFLNMMLLCSTAFMYESDIVIIGVPSINVKGKIAVKAKNRQNRIVKVL